MAQLKDLIVNGPSRFIGDVYATTFTGNLAGNATSATSASSAGNASTVAGLSVHSGRNNEANKIVRTDGNGYLQVGYINSSNGWNENNNSSPDRVWGSNASDSYLRTYRTSALSVGYATNAGTAVKVGNALTVTLNSGTTEGTNKFTYDGSGVKSLNITPSIIGAANASHTHNYIPITGGVEGEVEVYSIMERTLIGNPDNNSYVVIREDMCGPDADNQLWLIETGGGAIFESITGKLVSSLAIKLNGGTTEGTNLFTFNNSASKTIDITPSAIGAAAASHTHSYLPLSGGTMSNTNVVTNLNADLLDGYHASSFAKVASHNNLMSSSNEFTFASSAYAGEIFINYRTAGGTNGAITKYSFCNGAGGLLASISKGQFSGNAASASKWSTARTITLTGSVTGSVSIDGSQNVSLATTTNHTHTFDSLTSKPTTISGYGITDAYTKTQTDTKLSGYLPLSGGTISGPATTLVNFNSTGSESGIRFQLKNVSEGWAGYNDTYGTHLFIYADVAGDGANHTLGIRCNGNGYIDSNTILHSGNYNTYAPTLTGTGASGTWGISISGNAATVGGITGTIAPLTNVSTGYWGGLGYGSTNKLSIGSNYGGIAWNAQNYCAGLMFGCSLGTLGFISIGYNSPIVSFAGSNDSNASNDNPNWYFKLTGTSGTIYDLNCAPTATKLANSRTIWGQSFDGTGNVSGALTGVTDITASGHAKVDSLKSSYICIECDNSGNKGSHTSEINNYTSTLYLQYSTSNNCCICYGGGNVGIGTKSPSYKLDVNGSIRANGTIFSHEGCHIDGTSGSTYGKLEIVDNVDILGENANINFIESLNIKQHNTTDNTDTSIVSIDNSGNITLNVMNNNGGSYEISTRLGVLGIGIPPNDPNLIKTPSFLMSNQGYIYLNARVPSSPNYPLVVNGTIQCTTLSQTSDIKYKTNIKQIEYEEALKIIENLNPVTWDWNENTVETGSSSGFVAQEAEEFIPNAISRDNENNLSLDYTQLHSYEIRVIQEQQKEIIKLKEKLKILENLIS